MSKAFTKEDVDPPERSGRARSASGLPPGAVNYITARGARRLREELAELRGVEESGAAERREELKRILESTTIVEPPEEVSDEVMFGAAVTVRDAAGDLATYRVVGVDELQFEPDAVSWISSLGKALLAAELGGRVIIDNDTLGVVVKIEHSPE